MMSTNSKINYGIQKNEPDGFIRLEFKNIDGNTIATRTYREGNSRISANQSGPGNFPFYFLISTGGGYIEGEHYRQEVHLGRDAHAILTTQTPTYIYKCDHGRTTSMEAEYVLEENSVLELYLDEVIPFKNSIYQQINRITMGKNATLILCEGLTGGWSPDGQSFQYSRIDMYTRISHEKELLFKDRLLLEPQFSSLTDMGYFGNCTNYNTVTIVDSAINRETVQRVHEVLTHSKAGPLWGISLLNTPGLTFRVLDKDRESNHHLMQTLISLFREEIKHYPPLELRKTCSQSSFSP
jgi:urease accessory protein